MFFCGSFSLETKYQIKERAGDRSELSGQDDRPLHCSHLNHGKKSPYYDDQEIGILVTDIEHLAYHVKYLRNPRKIGLTKRENRDAIKTMWRGILSENNCTMEEICGRYVEAKCRWDEYEKENFPQDPRSKITPPSFSSE